MTCSSPRRRRIREFDEAEAELEKVLPRRKKRARLRIFPDANILFIAGAVYGKTLGCVTIPSPRSLAEALL
jgi:hypothetical protein